MLILIKVITTAILIGMAIGFCFLTMSQQEAILLITVGSFTIIVSPVVLYICISGLVDEFVERKR